MLFINLTRGIQGGWGEVVRQRGKGRLSLGASILPIYREKQNRRSLRSGKERAIQMQQHIMTYFMYLIIIHTCCCITHAVVLLVREKELMRIPGADFWK